MAIIERNSTSADWNLGTAWVGGTAPAGTDTALINATAAVQDITTDLGTIAAIAKLDIRPGYTGKIGGAANYLTCSFDVIHHVGTAELWVSDAAGTTDDVFIQCLEPSTIVHLAGATMTRIRLNRGNIAIDATMGAIALLTVGYVNSRGSDVKLAIDSNAGTVTEYIQNGGRVSAANVLTDAYINGGEFRQTGTKSITNLNVGPGARVNYDSSGTIAWLRCGPGSFTDLGDRALTVTDSVFDPGSVVKFDADLVTFTNATFDMR